MRRGTVVLLTALGVLGALLVAAALIRFVGMDAASYRVPSESMVPTVRSVTRSRSTVAPTTTPRRRSATS